MDNGQPKMKLKTFPTLSVVATAVAAYEHNKKSIFRNPVTVDGKGILSNRQLIGDYLQGIGGPFVVNDFHHKQAQGIVTYLEQTVIMQSLRGTPDRFLAQLSELIAAKEVSVRDLGIIAWAPHLVEQYQQKEQAREVGARYERSSRYIGRIGETITSKFTLIEKRYITSMNCYSVYGVDDHGNLIFYWAKNLDRVCEVGQIKGRIKAHKEDDYRNRARVTVLNYVKVV